MAEARQGEIVALDAVFVKDGAPTAVSSARITIASPDRSLLLASDAPVSRIGVGRYSFSQQLPDDAEPGIWWAIWEGRLPGYTVDSVAEDPFTVEVAGDYGAYGSSIAGVQKYLPHWPITIDSVPSSGQVLGFIEEIGARVNARLGGLAGLDAGFRLRILTHAQGLVNLGAAAMAEDAGHPETGGPGQSSYGSTLWNRFEAGLRELVALLPVDAASEADSASPDDGLPSVFAGPPLFRSYEPF